jgi:hypothetical protein
MISRFPIGKICYILADRCPTLDGTASFSVYHSGWRRTTHFLVRQQHSFKEFLRHQQDIGWVTEVQQCGAHFQDLAGAIERSELIGIGDGSYKDDMGTAAWRLFYINLEDQQWTGQLLVPGQPADQSAFRSELAGLYAMTTLVNSMVDYYEVPNGAVELACDRIQALEYFFDTKTSVTAANNSYDLILAMRKMIAGSRIRTRKRRHVKGHQDVPQDQLDIWGRANDDCDTDAKAFWAKCRQLHRTP